MKSHKLTEVGLTPDQKYKMDVALVAFMQESPFYAHLSHSLGRYVYTNQVPMAATDGRHIFLNPGYVCGLKVSEQIAVLCHEMGHLVMRHPQRFKHYKSVGDIKGLPVDHELANRAADYVINADIAATVPRASLNPDWLYDPEIKGTELWEDVYVRLFKQGGGKTVGDGQKESGQGGLPPGKLRRDAPGALRGAAGDPTARANNGAFDTTLDPPIDPSTQEVDLPGESEFQEAISRAAATAKAMGKLPGSLERLVNEILDPQVDWRDHIRMLITGKIGARHETWSKPNRRRLALNPIVIVPGKRGYGAERVVIGIDTSGSIGDRELSAFWAEVGGILNDCKPREIVVIGCDAQVREADVHRVASLDELDAARMKGLGGGGGTSFVPVFQYCEDHDLRPETLIYLTDLYGRAPVEAPPYPVVWCVTTDEKAPWGEVVRIKL